MAHPSIAPPQIVLVTGPSRSGKSEWAEQLAQASGRPVTYIATAIADPSDREWSERIQQHRQRRPSHWQTLEHCRDLPQAIAHCPPGECLLIDSLGTWLFHYLDEPDERWQQAVDALLCSLQTTAGAIIMVSEETGWGVVPAYPLGRLFRDRLGNLARQVGQHAQAVYLVTAGYAVDLRQVGQPVSSSISVV